MTLPNTKNNTVTLNLPEKAITKDTNKIITLIPFQPSIILTIYFPSKISFIEGSC